MDIRKVQMTGGSSYMITLPKEWAESVGIKKNDPVTVDVRSDGSLILTPGNAEIPAPCSVKTINVKTDSAEGPLYRQLIGAYIAGHNSIDIRSESPLSGAVANTVSSFTQTSIGMEIIEENDEHILIKDLMNHAEIKPMKGIERMKVLIKNMIADTFAAAVSGDVSNINNMDARDREVDRLHWLISRQVNIYQKDVTICSKTGLDLCTVTRCLSVSRILERIGDHAVVLSKNLIRLTDDNKAKAVDKSITEIGNDIIALFNTSLSGWIEVDVEMAESCIESGEKIVKRIEKTFKKIELELDTASSTSLIAGSSRRIAEYCIDISEQTINAAMS